MTIQNLKFAYLIVYLFYCFVLAFLLGFVSVLVLDIRLRAHSHGWACCQKQ